LFSAICAIGSSKGSSWEAPRRTAVETALEHDLWKRQQKMIIQRDVWQ
jgi:hypothetical protein